VKARRTAVAQTRARLEAQRAPTYRPAPMPWKGLLVGVGILAFLAVLTAPSSDR